MLSAFLRIFGFSHLALLYVSGRPFHITQIFRVFFPREETLVISHCNRKSRYSV